MRRTPEDSLTLRTYLLHTSSGDIGQLQRLKEPRHRPRLTYNEAENIEPLVLETLEAAQRADVLIVDDNGPVLGFTSTIAQNVAARFRSRVNGRLPL